MTFQELVMLAETEAARQGVDVARLEVRIADIDGLGDQPIERVQVPVAATTACVMLWGAL